MSRPDSCRAADVEVQVAVAVTVFLDQEDASVRSSLDALVIIGHAADALFIAETEIDDFFRAPDIFRISIIVIAEPKLYWIRLMRPGDANLIASEGNNTRSLPE